MMYYTETMAYDLELDTSVKRTNSMDLIPGNIVVHPEYIKIVLKNTITLICYKQRMVIFNTEIALELIKSTEIF